MLCMSIDNCSDGPFLSVDDLISWLNMFFYSMRHQSSVYSVLVNTHSNLRKLNRLKGWFLVLKKKRTLKSSPLEIACPQAISDQYTESFVHVSSCPFLSTNLFRCWVALLFLQIGVSFHPCSVFPPCIFWDTCEDRTC